MHRSTRHAAYIILILVLLQSCDTGVEPGVRVIRYDGPPITKEPEMFDQWTATIDAVVRTATLELVESSGRIVHRLQLHEIPDELPAFSGYTYRPESDHSARLYSGTIEIQHFELEGEISGRFEGGFRNGLLVESTFWVHADSQRTAIRRE